MWSCEQTYLCHMQMSWNHMICSDIACTSEAEAKRCTRIQMICMIWYNDNRKHNDRCCLYCCYCNVCICVYICTCISYIKITYLCISLSMCIYIYIYVHSIYVYIHIYTHMHVYIYIYCIICAHVISALHTTLVTVRRRRGTRVGILIYIYIYI